MSYATHENAALMLEEPTQTSSVPVRVHQRSLFPGKPLNILLVEDDPSDKMLTEIALKATKISHRLSTLRDGNDVISYLHGRGKFAGQPRPDVVLLDLSLPHCDGFEVLAEITECPKLQDIPIIILTGFEHYHYIMKVYGLWLPAYVTKPCSSEKLSAALERLNDRPKSCKPKLH